MIGFKDVLLFSVFRDTAHCVLSMPMPKNAATSSEYRKSLADAAYHGSLDVLTRRPV
jgi:hypothetical protein